MVRKPLLFVFSNNNIITGIFSLSYAVMPSFLVSVLFINLYLILKFNIKH